MNQPASYRVVLTSAARRRLGKLPITVAANPHQLGKPLDAPFDQVRSVRRGEYRALYTIDEDQRVVTVLAVAHRRTAYRPR